MKVKRLQRCSFEKAGYDPKILGDGAQVVEIMQESPVKGKIFPGDVIKRWIMR